MTNLVDLIAKAGGIFVILAFIHFVVDWIFQTHYEAMNKTTDWTVRARHCSVYTIGFVPILPILGLEVWEIAAAMVILFVSHHIEDTYAPVFLWAKYVRQVPELRRKRGDPKKAFVKWFNENPIAPILTITIDQLIHLFFLWPIVWMALN